MFKWISALLSRSSLDSDPAPTPVARGSDVAPPSATAPVLPSYGDDETERLRLLMAALAASPYFAPSSSERLIDHLLQHSDIHKEPPFLSTDQKRMLGMNPRQRISRAFADCLTDSGRVCEDPKEELAKIGYRVRGLLSRRRDVRGIRDAGFPAFKLMNCGDGRDCKWSRKVQKRRFPAETDIESLISSNCDAEYCRCLVVCP